LMEEDRRSSLPISKRMPLSTQSARLKYIRNA
jgi:hypothetical protein